MSTFPWNCPIRLDRIELCWTERKVWLSWLWSKAQNFFVFMPTWSLGSRGTSDYGLLLQLNFCIIKSKKNFFKVSVLVLDRIFCTLSCFFHTKLVKFWNYLPSTNATSPGVYIPVIAFRKLKISLYLSF